MNRRVEKKEIFFRKKISAAFDRRAAAPSRPSMIKTDFFSSHFRRLFASPHIQTAHTYTLLFFFAQVKRDMKLRSSAEEVSFMFHVFVLHSRIISSLFCSLCSTFSSYFFLLISRGAFTAANISSLFNSSLFLSSDRTVHSEVHMHQSFFTEHFVFHPENFSSLFSCYYVSLCEFSFLSVALSHVARANYVKILDEFSVRHPHTLHNVEFSCTDFSPDLYSSCMYKFGPFHYHSNILQRRFFFS